MGEPDPSLFDTAFWDRVAWSKRFTHPLDAGLLSRHLPRTARVLDYGCGYGRVLAELQGLGYSRAHGCDASERMIDRARTEQPAAELSRVSGLPLPFEEGSNGAVILFSVLTCIIDDAAQRRLVDELVRVLQPGGLLYVSDLGLQTDARNVERYAAAAIPDAPYGCIEGAGGERFRHLAEEWRAELFRDLEIVSTAERMVETMNGNPARAFQLLLRKP